MRIASQNVKTSDELVKLVDEDTEVVGIDEGQFFDANLPAACNTLADRGKRVIVAGLDQDYLGRPFEVDDVSACAYLFRSAGPSAAQVL